MIVDRLRKTYEQNTSQPLLFIRNLLKEQLQYYVLNYIYNSPYGQKFLFKGGTCLRFCFDLPRLSEDLDFDAVEFTDFNFSEFTQNLERHFKTKLQYEDLTSTISGMHKIIYLKFPILEEIGFPFNKQKPSEAVLFVRIDLAPVSGKFFAIELSLKSTADFSFLIRRYSLSDLYASKVAAILSRETMAGKERVARFKGRDFFDIWWLKEKNLKWNNKYLSSLLRLTESEIRDRLRTKIAAAAKRKSELKADLLPFFSSPAFVDDFVNNLDKLKF